ncbi:uncharacterized protein LOC134529084 [Bacillus rossius redtenbacheri]|uniref:uncharacterized protein LOC134529084 n=1 Tax=Bacillus rossius redtenbacheri TaxID=93214 RepID=UPI002FDE0D01
MSVIMAEALPGTSKDEFEDQDADGNESALMVKKTDTELTTIVPVRMSGFAFLDPYFGIWLKENSLGKNSFAQERPCLSIIESDFAALVLSGDKQIVRNGRVVKSFKVSAGNKHHFVLNTTESQKREINYLSHTSRKYSSIKKGKQLAIGMSSSQKTVLKQSLLNFVESNEWFAQQKLEDSQTEACDNQMVNWMDLKPCVDDVDPANVITTSGFKSLVRSQLSNEQSSEKLDVPVVIKTWSRDSSSNIVWKAAAVKSFGQKKLPLQQTCSEDDDITMNDLAGYFDNLVHIPKEMSSMAEMMYQ